MQVKARNIQPVFANPSRKVVRLLQNAKLPAIIGEDFITVRMNDAVLLCQVKGLVLSTKDLPAHPVFVHGLLFYPTGKSQLQPML